MSRAAGLVEALRQKAATLGFDACAIASADSIPDAAPRLAQWIAQGSHGDMDYMATTKERRGSPRALWPQARSIVMLGFNYGPERDPLEAQARRDRAAISVYARHRDYHDVLKGRLKQLAGFLVKRGGGEVKVFVDTAPVMEKPLAQAAGLGWQGKHTNLVSKEFGSWLFLGAVFTTLDLPPDASERDHCGSCRACLDICPTQAMPAPYQLDARRCVSYLTIEHKGPIPQHFRAAIGNRVYGCDDCLAVCPWNKFASIAREAKLRARPQLDSPPLRELAKLDDAGFRALFAGGPIKRVGHARFLRNVLIAIGNSGDPALAQAARPHLDSREPLARGAAIWALSRLLDASDFDALAQERAPLEADPAVREEWAKEPHSSKKTA